MKSNELLASLSEMELKEKYEFFLSNMIDYPELEEYEDEVSYIHIENKKIPIQVFWNRCLKNIRYEKGTMTLVYFGRHTFKINEWESLESKHSAKIIRILLEILPEDNKPTREMNAKDELEHLNGKKAIQTN